MKKTIQKKAPFEKLKAEFRVESALLEELGERLVSSAEVALTELVKNSFDADATFCNVTVTPNLITVKDDGNGMRREDFLNLWMVIGTRNKARNRLSPKFRRKVSGSKGIGRFAVRFLGEHMVLETVADDYGGRFRLSAEFAWGAVEANADLKTVVVPYTVEEVDDTVSLGTTIRISELRSAIEPSAVNEIGASLLDLVNPIDGFERPAFAFNEADENTPTSDPGFSPLIGISEEDTKETLVESPSEAILARFVGRARVRVSKSGQLDVQVYWNRGEEKVYEWKSTLFEIYGIKDLGTPVLMDIRHFPHRGGVLTSLGVDGRIARSWLSSNAGVKVMDNGFRVKPYGDRDDDWLVQSADKAQSSRAEWRSIPMRQQYPLKGRQLSPKDNPMLYLPGFNQAVGLVFVATSTEKSKNPDHRLTPSMDRQGFVHNTAFKVLQDLGRFGLELIALFDHKVVRDQEARVEEEALRSAEHDLKAAVRDIERSSAIEPEERKRLTGLLRNASRNYAEVDAYRKKTQESLEIMSLMGVLAGFMTHEFEKTVYRLTESTNRIRKIARKHPELSEDLKKLDQSQKYLETYLDYSRLFTENLSRRDHKPFPALGQIEMVIDTLIPIAEKNNINFDIRVSEDTDAPAVPVAAYSGLLLNLITNSMKSLIAKTERDDRIIRIIVTNTANKHRVIVADTGIGIPERLRDRIWEPLFTASSKTDSPLGTGMGLGLALVKRVTGNLKGKVELMETAPAGFSTSFSLELPRT